ncbi:MAG TPA: hypothetical protein PKC30_15310 [Saprospiraceae bacterium]|nr:hypothetical protein [Saprospiraceae bacterium]
MKIELQPLFIAITWLLICMANQISAQTMTPAPKSIPGLKPGNDPSFVLNHLLEYSSYSTQMQDGRLEGEGADFLKALARESQFVLVGEEHGHSGTAKFTTALWHLLHETADFEFAAFEIDRWVAETMEKEIRAGGLNAWTQFLNQCGGANTVPFFDWKEEVELADAIVKSSKVNGFPAIWGIEQVYIEAFEWQLLYIAKGAQNVEARQLAAYCAEEASKSRKWIVSNIDQFAQLAELLNNPIDSTFANMANAMTKSAQIYKPFIVGEGEYFLANHIREQMIRRNFLEYYRAAEKATMKPPRVMMKYGAYHLYRGATPTNVQGLGGFMTEFSVVTGVGGTLAMLVITDEEGAVTTFEDKSYDAKDWFIKNWGFLTPLLKSGDIGVFDLRAWRMRPNRWAHLPESTRLAINSYDILIVAPGSGSTLLPGLNKTLKP